MQSQTRSSSARRPVLSPTESPGGAAALARPAPNNMNIEFTLDASAGRSRNESPMIPISSLAPRVHRPITGYVTLGSNHEPLTRPSMLAVTPAVGGRSDGNTEARAPPLSPQSSAGPPTEPLFAPHPSESWVTQYLEAHATDDAVLQQEFQLTARTFLARYATMVKRGGVVADIPPTLKGLSLLLACPGSIRSRAAALSASVMQLPLSVDPSVIQSLFSFARDLIIVTVTSNTTLAAPLDPNVLVAVEAVALRIAGAYQVRALDEYDCDDLAQFAEQSMLLLKTTEESEEMVTNIDMNASLTTALAAFETLRQSPPAAATSSLHLAVALVRRDRGARDTASRRGDEATRQEDAEAVLMAVDADVSHGRLTVAKLSLQVLGLAASNSTVVLTTMMRAVGERFARGAWPHQLVHPYCQTLARVALGGQSSKIRSLVLDAAAPGSLITASGTGTADEGEDDDATQPRSAMRWAVVKALLTIHYGGAAAVAYSWLADAAAAALAARPDTRETAIASIALDRRAHACAQLISSSAGPFGLEHTLCATVGAVEAMRKPAESQIDLPPVAAPPARIARTVQPRKPAGIRKILPPKITPRVDVVTRNANGLRLLLGGQVLKEQERDMEQQHLNHAQTT